MLLWKTHPTVTGTLSNKRGLELKTKELREKDCRYSAFLSSELRYNNLYIDNR